MTYSAIPCDSRLRVATRYVASVQGASGDVHAMTRTPFGTRLLIGDVMGSGKPASQAGEEIVAAWHEIARSEPSLAGMAVRLHGLVTRWRFPERFVTALLINIAGGSAELVFCGHPSPLLLRGGSATFIDPCPAAPPLGLLDLADGWCSATLVPFGEGDRLLCYTDGVSEARDGDGRFFPLADLAAGLASEAAGGGLEGGAWDELLDVLVSELGAHIGSDRAADDMLLMLVERTLPG